MGLIYPAILGALIVETGPLLYSWPWTWDASQFLVFVMLVYYVLDYAYSVDNKSRRSYSWCKFPFDFISVWLIYAALKTAIEPPLDPSDVAQICWFMLAMKGCALGWEILGSVHPDNVARTVALVSDFFPMLFYVILICLYINGNLVPAGLVKLLIVIVILDAILYWIHEPVYQFFKRERPPAT